MTTWAKGNQSRRKVLFSAVPCPEYLFFYWHFLLIVYEIRSWVSSRRIKYWFGSRPNQVSFYWFIKWSWSSIILSGIFRVRKCCRKSRTISKRKAYSISLLGVRVSPYMEKQLFKSQEKNDQLTLGTRKKRVLCHLYICGYWPTWGIF